MPQVTIITNGMVYYYHLIISFSFSHSEVLPLLQLHMQSPLRLLCKATDCSSLLPHRSPHSQPLLPYLPHRRLPYHLPDYLCSPHPQRQNTVSSTPAGIPVDFKSFNVKCSNIFLQSTEFLFCFLRNDLYNHFFIRYR